MVPPPRHPQPPQPTKEHFTAQLSAHVNSNLYFYRSLFNLTTVFSFIFLAHRLPFFQRPVKGPGGGNIGVKVFQHRKKIEGRVVPPPTSGDHPHPHPQSIIYVRPLSPFGTLLSRDLFSFLHELPFYRLGPLSIELDR